VRAPSTVSKQNNIRARSISNFYVTFPFHPINTPSVTFKEIIEQWFSFDRVCELRGSSTERRTVIQNFTQILFIYFVQFHANMHRASRPISGYVTNNIVISNNRYHTIGAICHSGTLTRSGHYWCLLKQENTWMNINDDNISVKSRFVICK